MTEIAEAVIRELGADLNALLDHVLAIGQDLPEQNRKQLIFYAGYLVFCSEDQELTDKELIEKSRDIEDVQDMADLSDAEIFTAGIEKAIEEQHADIRA